MSSNNRIPGAVRTLPPRPSLEHLRNEAKRRHRLTQQTSPSAKLSEAQFAIARDYGFASWRALKAEVERMAPKPLAPQDGSTLDRFTGAYLVETDHAANAVISVTREGPNLFVQVTGGPKFELTEEADNVFTFPGLKLRYVFERNEDGSIEAVVVTNDHGDHRMPRIDAAKAVAVEEAFEAALKDQIRPRTEAKVDPSVLERVTGVYSKPLGPPVKIILDDGRLFAQLAGQDRSEIFPESETKFFSRLVPAQFSFEIEADKASAVVLHQNGREFRFPRSTEAVAKAAAQTIEQRIEAQRRPRAAIKLDHAILERYAGDYQLATGRALTVTAEKDRLYIQLAGQERYEVFAESEREFFWTVVAAQITFILGESGGVTSAILHQSGRDIPIARLDGHGLNVEAA